jgi:hypothetical protein
MSVFSVAEDFWLNTLNAVPGVWGKLRYVSSLRQADGRYEHWGLARKYGENEAQQAIREAHRELTLAILRTPLRELLEETANAAQQSAVSLRDYVALLSGDVDALLPVDFRGWSERHLRTILESLSCLAPTYTGASRQAS